MTRRTGAAPTSRRPCVVQPQGAREPRAQTYREILYLHLSEGLSYQEIGRKLGFTASTTREYFFRALRTARTLKWR